MGDHNAILFISRASIVYYLISSLQSCVFLPQRVNGVGRARDGGRELHTFVQDSNYLPLKGKKKKERNQRSKPGGMTITDEHRRALRLALLSSH